MWVKMILQLVMGVVAEEDVALCCIIDAIYVLWFCQPAVLLSPSTITTSSAVRTTIEK